MPQYPKFSEKLRNGVVDPMMRAAHKPGYAVVLAFNTIHNTCDVMAATQGSDEVGEILTNLPAPFQQGIQQQAPQPGWMCWIAYRDGTTADPYITHFFNPKFSEHNYQAQYTARNDIPYYMVQM